MRKPHPKALLPYQGRFLADPSAVKVAGKSRRTGITFDAAVDACLVAAPRSGGSNIKYTSYNKEFTAEFIETCAWWCKRLQVGFSFDGSRQSFLSDKSGELKFSLRFASGNKITGVSSNPANLRGGPNDKRIIIDEAAHIPDLPEIMKAADAIRMWGGKIVVISTHNGADSFFNLLCEEIKEGRRVPAMPVTVERLALPDVARYADKYHADSSLIYRNGPYALHSFYFYRAVDEGLYYRICQTTGQVWSFANEQRWIDEQLVGEGAEEEYLGRPSKSGVKYFHLDVIDACSVEGRVLRINGRKLEIFTPPKNAGTQEMDEWTERCSVWCDEWLRENLDPVLASLTVDDPFYLGLDYGRVMDLTVLAPLRLHMNMHTSVPFVVELLDVPDAVQLQIASYLVDRLPRFSGAALDNTGSGRGLCEQLEYKFGGRRKDGTEGQIERINIKGTFYNEHFPVLKAGMTSGKVTFPEDRDLRGDLRAVERINGGPRIPDVRTKSKSMKGERRHGDFAVALLLAHYKSRTTPPITVPRYMSDRDLVPEESEDESDDVFFM